MTDTRNIVILGASYAGLSAAHYFLKHVEPALPREGRYHVHLVNPSTHFYHRIAAPRATASSQLMPDSKSFLDIADGFKQYSKDVFTFVQARATSLDTTSRTVTIERVHGGEETLSYHALILATGTKSFCATLSSQGRPHEEIKAALADMHGKLKNAKTVMIGGGGPAGVETAAEVGEMLNGAAFMFMSGLSKPKVKVTLVAGARKLLPILRPALAKQAETYLARVGVETVYKDKVNKTEQLADSKTKVLLDSGKEVVVDVYIPAIGVVPMTEYVPKELLTEKGYVKTNDKTLRVDEAGPRVYAVGDCGSHTRGGIFDIYDAIPVLLTNIKRDILLADSPDAAQTKGGDRSFKAITSETQMVTVGRSKGVGAYNGRKLPSFMIWAFKGRDFMSGTAVETVNGTRWKKEVGWKPSDG